MEKPYGKNMENFTIPTTLQKEMIKFFHRVFTPENSIKNAEDKASQQPLNKKAEVVKND